MQSRDKMISFRISMKEYEKLRECCLARGVRSISELARTALGKLIGDPQSEDNGLEGRVRELEGRLQTLTLELQKLKEAD